MNRSIESVADSWNDPQASMRSLLACSTVIVLVFRSEAILWRSEKNFSLSVRGPPKIFSDTGYYGVKGNMLLPEEVEDIFPGATPQCLPKETFVYYLPEMSSGPLSGFIPEEIDESFDGLRVLFLHGNPPLCL